MGTDRCKGFDCRHTWVRACLSLIERYGPMSVKQVIGGSQSAVNHRPIYLRGLKRFILGLLESL